MLTKDASKAEGIILRPLNLRTYLIVCLIIPLGLILPVTGQGGCFSLNTTEYYGWNDCGGIGWHIDPYNGHNNSPPSLISGPIENTGVSSICKRDVRGPATVSFWWKADMNPQKIGQLSFYVDDTIKYICGSSYWEYVSYSIRDNKTHELTWMFNKIRSYPQNIGAGWIDDVYVAVANEKTIASQNIGKINNTTESFDLA
jgi:hypothetical protein